MITSVFHGFSSFWVRSKSFLANGVIGLTAFVADSLFTQHSRNGRELEVYVALAVTSAANGRG